MNTGTEALKLLLLVFVAILIEVSVKKLIVSSLLTTMISKEKTPLRRRGSTPMCGALDHDEGACHRKGRRYHYKQ